MDEEDLDNWYEENKERITEFYQNQIKTADLKLSADKRPKVHEKLKIDYEKRLKKLQSDYESRSERLINSNLKKHFFNHRINMLFKKIKGKILHFFKKE